MAKPSSITTWATDVGATADPGSTRRATGFVAGKRLPAKWLNWILNQNGAWLTYLRDLHTEPEFLNKDYAWTGKHRYKVNAVDFDGVHINDAGELTYLAADGVTELKQTFYQRALSLTDAATNMTYVPDTGTLNLSPAGGVSPAASWDLSMPTETELVAVTAYCYVQAGATASASSLRVRTWTQGGPGFPLLIEEHVAAIAPYTGDTQVTLTLPAPIAFDRMQRLQISWTGSPTGSSYTQRLNWVMFDWRDPGPRNR